MTVHTPEWLWLSSGVRAIHHAVETLLSLDANDYTDGTALQALRALGAGLPSVKKDARISTATAVHDGAGSPWLGIVSGTRLGASHAIGHILGGSANVPHGHTSCVMLPYVLDFNAQVNSQRQREVSAAMGRPEKSASEVLDDFIRGLGMPRRLREVKVEEADLPRLAQNCMLDDWTYSNPRPISRSEEVLEILRRHIRELAKSAKTAFGRP